METQPIKMKSLSRTCDVKVSDILGKIIILSLDEGLFSFFTDIISISYKPVEGVEGYYSNCSNKDPTELKPKEQGFDEAALIEQKHPHQELWVLYLIGHLDIYSKLKKTK
jgi:hypothetical protein